MGGRRLPESGGCVAVTVSRQTFHVLWNFADGSVVNHDDFMSRFRMTNFSRDEVLRKL